MLEVVPGIYRLVTPIADRMLPYVNAYLIKGRQGCLLIDSCWVTEQSFSVFSEQLQQIGVSWRQITLIILTHTHADHYGLAGRLHQMYGIKLASHEIEARLIQSRYTADDRIKEEERYLLWNGVPENQVTYLKRPSMEVTRYVVSCRPETVLYGGETVSTDPFNFQVLWTPGHSPGHICLYEPDQKILVSGDCVLPSIPPNIFLSSSFEKKPLASYLESLSQLAKLEVSLVLPGHESTFTNLSERIKQLVQYHTRQAKVILDIVKGKPKSCYEVALSLPWTAETGGITWEKASSLEKLFAIMRMLAYLDFLSSQGQVYQFTKDGVAFYSVL